MQDLFEKQKPKILNRPLYIQAIICVCEDILSPLNN